LVASVRDKYLLVSDDPRLAEGILANFSRKSDRRPGDLLAGFDHQREGVNFARLSRVVDRPSATMADDRRVEPQFFSGNMASLSTTLAAVSSEQIEVRSQENKERQTVIYEWAQ
jgi:hypothetical protein